MGSGARLDLDPVGQLRREDELGADVVVRVRGRAVGLRGPGFDLAEESGRLFGGDRWQVADRVRVRSIVGFDERVPERLQHEGIPGCQQLSRFTGVGGPQVLLRQSQPLAQLFGLQQVLVGDSACAAVSLDRGRGNLTVQRRCQPGHESRPSRIGGHACRV